MIDVKNIKRKYPEATENFAKNFYVGDYNGETVTMYGDQDHAFITGMDYKKFIHGERVLNFKAIS
jgi:hypothetical protein